MMGLKKIFFIIVLFLSETVLSYGQGFEVRLSAPQYHGGTVYLTYYYGQNLNVEDSAFLDSKGETVFRGKGKLLPGVYSVVLPGKSIRLDFLVGGEQKLVVKIKDSSNPILSAVVSGSKENDLFTDYQKFVYKKGAEIEKEKRAYALSKTSADSALHQQRFSLMNAEIANYREDVMEKHPESMLAALFHMMKEPVVPHPVPRSPRDSAENYQYYKKHFWDGVTFRDDRMIRTPFFVPKLEKYFEQVLVQHPDTLIKESDYLILLSRTDQQMYQFLINWFTDEYYSPKIMGQDKVFVHLFEKYHAPGISTWLSDAQHDAISRRAYMVMSNLIGAEAPPLVMTDISGKINSLYNLDAAFTVVSFWTPTCSHCQKEMPVLDSIYQAKWKKEGVKIYAVLTENAAMDEWKEFIGNHHLQEWANVYETDAQRKALENAGKPPYQQLYDVLQTPTLYLLDKDKRIIAKKLMIDQLDELIDRKLNMTGKTQ